MNAHMTRNAILLIIIFFVNCNLINAQVFNTEKDLEKFQSQIKIQNFVGSLLTYPFESLQKKEIGVLIGEIKLMPEEKQDSVFISNSISKNIDNLFLNTLNITLANYRKDLELLSEDNIISFYVIYKIENNDFEISYNNIPERLIGPMKLTMDNIIKSTNPQTPYITLKINPDSYYLEKIQECRTKLESLELNSNDNKSIKEKLNAKLKSQKENQIIENLNELIRRNPFNRELLKQRAELYTKHNDLKNAERDYSFIKKYMKSPIN